jgi:hypothetical protein
MQELHLFKSLQLAWLMQELHLLFNPCSWPGSCSSSFVISFPAASLIDAGAAYSFRKSLQLAWLMQYLLRLYNPCSWPGSCRSCIILSKSLQMAWLMWIYSNTPKRQHIHQTLFFTKYGLRARIIFG